VSHSLISAQYSPVPLPQFLTDSPSVPHNLISAQYSPVPLPQFLTDSPSVPHNLILAQYSPVPLPQFQMAPTKALRECRGIALLYFQTSALEGGEGSASCPDHLLPPGKTRYPLYRRLGGPQGRSGQVWKISPPPSSP
jgi:hypothetical protein